MAVKLRAEAGRSRGSGVSPMPDCAGSQGAPLGDAGRAPGYGAALSVSAQLCRVLLVQPGRSVLDVGRSGTVLSDIPRDAGAGAPSHAAAERAPAPLARATRG